MTLAEVSKKEGEQNTNLSIAKRMLVEDADIEFVIKVTGLKVQDLVKVEEVL